MDEITRILVFTTVFTLSAVILLLLSFTISRRRRLEHKKQLLEKEFKTREEALLQVSRDLHDEIGSSLSGINMLTQLAMQQKTHMHDNSSELLQKISAYTNEVIEKVSDMAWLMKPQQESLSILISKLKTYSLATAVSKNIVVHFNDVPEILKVDLSIQQRKALYLISKEAINNAIKYANCQNIYYRITLIPNKLKLQIKDDGKGFLVNNIIEGNGLKNIRARAEEIKAVMKINSAPGKGTILELEI
ncbi:MAG: sensor histidine kinase [Chitinophagaceae bacterium]